MATSGASPTHCSGTSSIYDAISHHGSIVNMGSGDAYDRATWPTQHFAFTVEEVDIEAAATVLQQRGVVVEGPVYHEWMPAKSVYFYDPDGHDLELCAPVRKA